MRACYAAVSMQDAIGRYAEELRREQGLDVQIRVGLNSGEVVVRSIGSDLHMDYTAVGQTTHLAARMEQLARPGTTLITASTLRLAEGFVEVTPLGPVPLKGLANAVEIYELVRARPLRSRLRAAAAQGLSRFVGRDGEMEQLQRALERAGDGHGQVVAVIGEPGVGKSRLFYEFVHSHRAQGWFVLESFSVSYGKATAYLPVIDLLKTYFQVADRDDARTIRAKVTGHVLTLDESLRDTIPALLALLDALPADSAFPSLDPAQRRQRTLDALKRLLLRESQVRPLLGGVREPPLDRLRDAGLPQQPHRQPADGAPLAARQLSPRVSARVGKPDLLHAAPPRSAASRERGRAAARAPGRRCQPAVAEPAPDRAHGGEPLLPRGERPRAGRDAGAGRRARGLSTGPVAPGDPGPGHGAGRAGGPYRSAAIGRKAAAPDRGGGRDGGAVPAAPGRRRACPRRTCGGASPSCRRPSSSTRRASFPSWNTPSSTR